MPILQPGPEGVEGGNPGPELTLFRVQPWPERRYGEPFPEKYRQRSACMDNAWWFATDHLGEVDLVVGYAAHSIGGDRLGWFGHWWCVDVERRVVDPTWNNAGLAYAGLRLVDPLEIRDRVLGIGKYAGRVFHEHDRQIVDVVPNAAMRARLELMAFSTDCPSVQGNERSH